MKQVRCPICNQRLFDAREGDKAMIDIKCTRCGKVVQVMLSDKAS